MFVFGILLRKYTMSNIIERGLNIMCKGVKQNLKSRNTSLSFYHKITRTLPSRHLARRTFVIHSSLHGYGSIHSAVSAKKGDEVEIKSNFQDMVHTRKSQAHQSVLIAVENKADIPFAVGCFEKYGSIENIYSYNGESENCFLLVEFSSETSVQNLLSNCVFKSIDHAFPVSSRILIYEKKFSNMPADLNINIKEERCSELSFGTGANISEVIEKTFLNEKLTELDIRLRFFLCSIMKDSIYSLFPHCDVLPFGSSVNGVGKHGCDLDIVIRLYPEKANGDGEFSFLSKTCDGRQKNLHQKTLYRLGEFFLFSPGMTIFEKVMFARVPILKMNHRILKIDFDVSINNVSAVLMSDMLYFCGEIDSRVRPLIHVVKKWAKESNITKESPGYQISNFGLTNLVLFFLQAKMPHPILPALNQAFVILGSDNSYGFRLQYLKSLEEWKKYASLNTDSLGMLLKKFLEFLSSYPFHGNIISLLSGETRTREEDSIPLYMEYPLDEGLNITKNVSKAEYDCMCEKARVSAIYLEKNFNQIVKTEADFSAILGIPSVSRIGIKSTKFNVRSVLEDGRNSRNRNVKYKV